MPLATNKSIRNLPTCPLCAEPAPLAFIKASDGREWVNCACRACGMAMDQNDNWTCYLGGIKPNK